MGERDGLLFLTTHRLLFEGRMTDGRLTQALRGPRLSTLLDVPLRQISNAHVDPRLIGRPTLRVDLQGHARSFRVVDAASWYSSISVAKRQAGPPSSWPGQPSPVVVHVQTPPAPPPPPATVRARCPYCKTVYDEAVGNCPSCGSRFY